MATSLSQLQKIQFSYDGVTETNTRVCLVCDGACTWATSNSGGNATTGPGQYLALVYTLINTCLPGGYPYADVSITYDSFTVIGNRFIVYADGVSLFDSGCVTGSGYATFRIPDGTERYDIVVYGDCNSLGPGDLWSFSTACL